MFLLTPNLPFMKKKDRRAPFYGLNSKLPILLALILGFDNLGFKSHVQISTCTRHVGGHRHTAPDIGWICRCES